MLAETKAATDAEERDAAIRAAFESASDRMPWADFDQFQALTSDWDCHPIRVDGEIVGAVLSLGPEIHACVKPHAHKRWASKALFSVLHSVIRRFGEARTSVRTDCEAGIRFVQRLGFEEVGRAAGIVSFVKVQHGN